MPTDSIANPDPKSLTARQFDQLIRALGPFERRPRLAIAVSGGADSMALCLLAAEWAERRGGSVIALTVDHGLRSGSRRESRQVGRWAAAWGIDHAILNWDGPKPTSGVQAAAREARYRLLVGYCRRRGVFHLLLAHQLDDQAETVLMRLGRGSGASGLAAMAPIVELPHVRLLRPLLSVPHAVLVETLKRRGQDWIEDPSNSDPAHLRVRIRREARLLKSVGLERGRLAATASRLAAARVALESATVDLLVASTVTSPLGYVHLDVDQVAAAPPEISRRALASMLSTVGSSAYGPRGDRLSALHRELVDGRLIKPRTLGGCHLLPDGHRLLVCREPAAASERVLLRGQRTVTWDNRFRLGFSVAGRTLASGMVVARLGRAGWSQVVAENPKVRRMRVPFPVAVSLPAICDSAGPAAVPHLGYGRGGAGLGRLLSDNIDFVPIRPLAPASFTVAIQGPRPISRP